MSVPEPRGTIEQEPGMVAGNANVEVIATELRLFKEELMRLMNDQRDELRNMRSDMASNYVHHKVYMADQGRQDDRTQALDTDMLEVKTTIGAMGVELHGHIDRRFDEIGAQVKERCDDIAEQVKDHRESRRWSWGIVVGVGAAVLTSVTAIAVALIQTTH